MLDHAKFSDNHAAMWSKIVTISGVITHYLSATTQFDEQVISNNFYGH